MSDDIANPAPGGRLVDDLVLPFRMRGASVSGRLVRLGVAVDQVIAGHDYPESVSRTLGEAIALTALLGASLKLEGKLILQTKTDGPISMVVTDYHVPGHVRGYAGYDAKRLAAATAASARPEQGALLGNGHLAMTIDQGDGKSRYQGIVALDGQSLVDAAHIYFRQSEQLPTFIRLAVARHFAGGRWSWRAGGLMIQHVPFQAGQRPDLKPDETGEERDQTLAGDDDEAWSRVRILAETVEDHELLDPTLSPERLLFRLFHEENVTAAEPAPVTARCRCSRERIHALLQSFGADELKDMREADGNIAVTCEFCSTRYAFDPAEVN